MTELGGGTKCEGEEDKGDRRQEREKDSHKEGRGVGWRQIE